MKIKAIIHKKCTHGPYCEGIEKIPVEIEIERSEIERIVRKLLLTDLTFFYKRRDV